MKKSVLTFLLVVLTAMISSAFGADTLEVFVLRVQFKEESPDNSLTTGLGTFGTIPTDKYSYNLDPPKQGGSVVYWQKHLEFANNYFQAASGGKVAIRSRIFPIYTLNKKILDYNRTEKMDGEKTAEFDESRSRDYLTFIYDAVVASASKDDSENSPFRIPLSKNPNVKRAYMIAHAGASRLVDGGSMGTKNADTPGDFIDVYISNDAWEYLLPDSAKSEMVRPTRGVNETGDTVTNGLSIRNSVIDTLKSIMVVSEAASQDGLNWGINGIVVNQLAREMGLPNTYDMVKGISRLGYFDLMDFAGYSAGNGFLPALPAAWERSYMGWSKVKEVRPTVGKPVNVKIGAAGTGQGDAEIVKVPLSGNEYLLIENRQRSWNSKGTVDVSALSRVSDDEQVTVKTVPVDSLNLVFEDSVCTNAKCKVNSKKSKGLIVGLSSYDAGIPASGIAVWKVNEWYLKESMKYGAANLWGGENNRDHQYGISLVEADGVLSIGKTFKNSIGEDTYDYGSGTDLLPHLRLGTDKSVQKYSTITTINPTGYANTMTTQGGYTGIKVSVAVPDGARKEKTANAFQGDSVLNYGATVITVTISIDDGSIAGGKFPREVGLNTAVRGAVLLDYPQEANRPGEKALVFAAEDGTIQVLSALGDTLFASDTSVTVPRISSKDTVQDVPLYRVTDYAGVAKHGKYVGMASNGSEVFTLYEDGFAKTYFGAGMDAYHEFTKNGVKNSVGPMIVRDELWYGGGDTLWRDGNYVDLPKDFSIQDVAFCGDPSKTVTYRKKSEYVSDVIPSGNYVAAVGKGGYVALIEDYAVTDHGNRLAASYNTVDFRFDENSVFRIGCTDLDRDSVDEVIILGSRGRVTAIKSTEINDRSKKAKKSLWSREYKRGAAGKSGLVDETSGMAIGDINDDGYPEIVFLGDNLVYALDRSGVAISGFPVTISRGTPVTAFLSDPLLVDVTGDKVPEILVPSSDGLVYAYTGKGKEVGGQFPLAAGSFAYADSVGTGYSVKYGKSTMKVHPMSIFVADAVPSAVSAGPEIYAFHRSSVNAFRLQKASSDAAENVAAWTLPAGGNERRGYLDASKLKDVAASKAKDEITEFYVYPNPVRGGEANVRFDVGAEVTSATFEIYDITGLCVVKTDVSDAHQGTNLIQKMDLKRLGSDVYTARLKVKFKSGKTKQKLYKLGVIR